MENKIKKLAVTEILKIYKGNSSKRNLIIQALGEVGGKDAIEALVAIHKGNSSKRDLIIHSLGEAGKNS